MSNVLSSIETNIDELKNYKSVLVNIDLVKMSTLTDISKKILIETAKLLGSTYSSEVLNLKLKTAERNIKNLQDNLLELDRNLSNKNIDNEKKSIDNIELDKDTLNTILSIGSALKLNEFRLETLTKIQLLQLRKSTLLNEKELLKLPFEYTRKDLSLENISTRILELTEEVNGAIDQVYKFTEPKKSVQFLRHPEIVRERGKLDIKIAILLSLISFFFISFIAILLPRKS